MILIMLYKRELQIQLLSKVELPVNQERSTDVCVCVGVCVCVCVFSRSVMYYSVWPHGL